MERLKITVVRENEKLDFEVADYLHHENEHCKFEVFKDNRMIASFEPDQHHFLHVCKNPGTVDEELLHLIADQLERLPNEAKQ